MRDVWKVYGVEIAGIIPMVWYVTNNYHILCCNKEDCQTKSPCVLSCDDKWSM